MTLNNATMVNCTVVSNTATANAAVSLIKYNQSNASKVVNCVIWDNVRTDGTVANCRGYDGYKNDCTSCCTLPALPDEHSISNNPHFKHPEKADGVLKKASPCAKAGVYNEKYHPAGVLDLLGRELVDEKGRVPMGCYRTDPSGLTLLVR